jgi:hypothetical protein
MKVPKYFKSVTRTLSFNEGNIMHVKFNLKSDSEIFKSYTIQQVLFVNWQNDHSHKIHSSEGAVQVQRYSIHLVSESHYRPSAFRLHFFFI